MTKLTETSITLDYDCLHCGNPNKATIQLNGKKPSRTCKHCGEKNILDTTSAFNDLNKLDKQLAQMFR